MKSLIRTVAVAAVVFASSLAHADAYQAKYTGLSGDVFIGNFDGILDGDIFRNVAFTSFSIDGQEVTGALRLIGSRNLPAVISKSGLSNNFTLGDGPVFTVYFASYFLPRSGDIEYLIVDYRNPDAQIEKMEFVEPGPPQALGHWEVNAISAVPEPEAFAMMLAGLGVLGFMRGNRKKA